MAKQQQRITMNWRALFEQAGFRVRTAKPSSQEQREAPGPVTVLTSGSGGRLTPSCWRVLRLGSNGEVHGMLKRRAKDGRTASGIARQVSGQVRGATYVAVPFYDVTAAA